MNTEQLKTPQQHIVDLTRKSYGEDFKGMNDSDTLMQITRGNSGLFIKAMQDFASQESKIAVEKDRESRWISVKEKLPEEGTFEVLLKVDEPFFGTRTPRMIVAYYEHEEKRWKCDLTSREVYHGTHWQPLPEPPKQLTP